MDLPCSQRDIAFEIPPTRTPTLLENRHSALKKALSSPSFSSAHLRAAQSQEALTPTCLSLPDSDRPRSASIATCSSIKSKWKKFKTKIIDDKKNRARILHETIDGNSDCVANYNSQRAITVNFSKKVRDMKGKDLSTILSKNGRCINMRSTMKVTRLKDSCLDAEVSLKSIPAGDLTIYMQNLLLVIMSYSNGCDTPTKAVSGPPTPTYHGFIELPVFLDSTTIQIEMCPQDRDVLLITGLLKGAMQSKVTAARVKTEAAFKQQSISSDTYFSSDRFLTYIRRARSRLLSSS